MSHRTQGKVGSVLHSTLLALFAQGHTTGHSAEVHDADFIREGDSSDTASLSSGTISATSRDASHPAGPSTTSLNLYEDTNKAPAVEAGLDEERTAESISLDASSTPSSAPRTPPVAPMNSTLPPADDTTPDTDVNGTARADAATSANDSSPLPTTAKAAPTKAAAKKSANAATATADAPSAPSAPSSPSVPPSTPATEWFAELSWLLPLISGWDLEGISAESHLFYEDQPPRPSPPGRRGPGRPPTSATKKGKPLSKVKEEASRELDAGVQRTVFRVVLRHTRQPEERMELLVPTSVAGGESAAALTMSVNLANPELVVYDVTHAQQLTVQAATAQLLASSARIAAAAAASSTHVKQEPATPTASTKATQKARAKKAGKTSAPAALKRPREATSTTARDHAAKAKTARTAKRKRADSDEDSDEDESLSDSARESSAHRLAPSLREEARTAKDAKAEKTSLPPSPDGRRPRGRPRKTPKQESQSTGGSARQARAVKQETVTMEDATPANKHTGASRTAKPQVHRSPPHRESSPREQEEKEEEEALPGLTQPTDAVAMTDARPSAPAPAPPPAPALPPPLVPPFTSLLAMEEALSSSLALSPSPTSSPPPLASRHVTEPEAVKVTALTTHHAHPLKGESKAGQPTKAGTRTLADLFMPVMLSAEEEEARPASPVTPLGGKARVKSKRTTTPPPPPKAENEEAEKTRDDAVVPAVTAEVETEAAPLAVVLAPPICPHVPSKLVFRGHRLPSGSGGLHAAFHTPSLLNARVVAATTMHRRLPSPSRARHAVSPSTQLPLTDSGMFSQDISASPLTPSVSYDGASGEAAHLAAGVTARGVHVRYLAALDVLRKQYAHALSTRQRRHRTCADASALSALPPVKTTKKSEALSSSLWRRWGRVTRAQAARQEVRQWMREGLQIAAPSAHLRGDTLAAGIRALDVAERDDLAYVGGDLMDTDTTTRIDSVTRNAAGEQDAAVHLPGLVDVTGSSAVSAEDGLARAALPASLPGSLSALGGDGAGGLSWAASSSAFPRTPPPDFLPISGFALLQAQERISASLHATPFTTVSAATASSEVEQARCVLYPEGIPSTEAMPITNTFRTHSPFCAVPSGMPARSSADPTQGPAEADCEAVQQVAVPNPFQDAAYYVHRRLLPHRLREEVDEDGVLAITADGVYPDTELVKARKRAQQAALREKALAVTNAPEALALQEKLLSEVERPTPDASAPSGASDETNTVPLTSPTGRASIDDSEAVGDQVDRLLKRGHMIKRVPMPNIEWNYGPI